MMVRVMEGMNERAQGREESGMIRGVELVRTGGADLPALQPWTPSQGPLQLGDWMLLSEPIVSDLTATSQEWWSVLVQSSESWYQYHMSLPPLSRLQHEAKPPDELNQEKWQRLERRMSSMMLQAIPETVKEELVASRRLTAFGILTHLYLTYCPGGVMEKQTLLRSLEDPAEIGAITEAPAALRRWLRWRQRATEIGASMPDASLLMKGINKMVRRVLEGNKELQFRVSLARNTLAVDVAPTQTTVTQFATHLLAEVDQAALSDKRGTSSTTKPDPKIKAMDGDKADDGQASKGRDRGDKGKKGDCRFFLTDTGCRRGRECPWSHDQKDGKKRCYACGSLDHMSNVCTRPKANKEKDGTPKGKVAKAEVSEEGSSPVSPSKKPEEVQEGAPTVKELLEEANRMLRSISTAPSSTSSTTSTKEEEEKRDVMERLHQQLKALKTFQIRKLSSDNTMGLVDSGATHALRPQRSDEDASSYPEVVVALANGQSVRLRRSPGSAMLSGEMSIEPIIPMGALTGPLRCEIKWTSKEVAITHPEKGLLPVTMIGGCPHLPRALTLQLISELEDFNKGVSINQLTYEDEVKWMDQLVKSHPALKDLPEHIQRRLVVRPGTWNDIPGSRRLRKRWQRDGVSVHLYAGPDSGFTLANAWKQVGGDPMKLLELDVLRSPKHDMLADDGVCIQWSSDRRHPRKDSSSGRRSKLQDEKRLETQRNSWKSSSSKAGEGMEWTGVRDP